MTETISDKRELILQAALKIFSEKGFHKAKVEEIASLAGVGKGTVYEYFSSKRELFQEIFLAIFQKNMQLLKNEISPNLGPKEAIEKILEAQLDFVIKNQDVATLMMNEHQEIDKEFKIKIFSLSQQRLNFISEYVDKGITQGCFRQVNSYLVAIAMDGMVHAILGSFLTNEPTVTKISFEDIKSLLFDGLEKRDIL